MIRSERLDTHRARLGAALVANERRDRLDNRLGVAGRLDDNMILVRQLGGERGQMIARHVHAAQSGQSVAVDYHRLGKRAVDKNLLPEAAIRGSEALY